MDVVKLWEKIKKIMKNGDYRLMKRKIEYIFIMKILIT